MPACTYCRRPLKPFNSLSRLASTRDHVVPVSKGGKQWVYACRQCNSIKADMLPHEWSIFMAQNPAWWTLPHLQFGQLKKPPMTMRQAVAKAAAETDYRVVVTGDYRKPIHPLPADGEVLNENLV